MAYSSHHVSLFFFLYSYSRFGTSEIRLFFGALWRNCDILFMTTYTITTIDGRGIV